MKIRLFIIGFTLVLCYAPMLISADIQAKPSATFQFAFENNEPLYQTSLPAAAYQYLQTDSLRDISITNGNGEPVPYSVLPYQSLHSGKSQTQTRQILKFITIEQSQLTEQHTLEIQLEKLSDRTTVNLKTPTRKPAGNSVFLIDLGKKREPLTNLTLDWHGRENELIPLEILASDNLKDWSFIEQIVLLKSRQNGQTLLNNSFNLPSAVTARYLQLRSAASAFGEFDLSNAETGHLTDEAKAPPYQWATLGFMDRRQFESGDIELKYELDGRYPVSQLKISLPEENTITSVKIYTKNADKESWRFLTSAAIYRVQKNSHSTANPDISVPETVARYWQLQFNETKGGIGKQNPGFAAAWLPHTLVWNARGKAPFQLTTGNNPNKTNLVAVTDLITDYDAQKILALPKAALTLKSIDDSAGSNISGPWFTTLDYKRWLLWAGLVLGVLLLAFMAYSLLNNDHSHQK